MCFVEHAACKRDTRNSLIANLLLTFLDTTDIFSTLTSSAMNALRCHGCRYSENTTEWFTGNFEHYYKNPSKELAIH